MSFLRKATITSLLITQLAGCDLALPNYSIANGPPISVAEQQARLAELKGKLKKDFSEATIDSYFEDPNFKFEMEIFDRTQINPEKELASGKKDYDWYRRAIKLEEKLIGAPPFMMEYFGELFNAERKHGVDKRFIVGILGIESGFKKSKKVGKYRAFNALVTLYVLTPKKEFAYRELTELIKYSQRTRTPIFNLNSSYAGAIGRAQFIPSSLNRLFVGKNGNVEKANPMDMVDSIYSVSYYLKQSGWDKTQNGATPEKNSRNWDAIFDYNKSEAYVRAVIEIATSLSSNSPIPSNSSR